MFLGVSLDYTSSLSWPCTDGLVTDTYFGRYGNICRLCCSRTPPQHVKGCHCSGCGDRYQLQCCICHCSRIDHHCHAHQHFAVEPSARDILLFHCEWDDGVDEQRRSSQSIQHSYHENTRDHPYHLIISSYFHLWYSLYVTNWVRRFRCKSSFFCASTSCDNFYDNCSDGNYVDYNGHNGSIDWVAS
jgi:hypothetical protein